MNRSRIFVLNGPSQYSKTILARQLVNRESLNDVALEDPQKVCE